MGQDYLHMNTTVLAYLGDAVYETKVRSHVIGKGQVRGDRLHKAAVRYVRAEGQAMVAKAIFPDLPEEEQKLMKRARNRKVTSHPKHGDLIEYKWATAFEALIGYLHLSGQTERLEKILDQALLLVEGEKEGAQ